MTRLAWLLDNSIRIPIINYRIGLDAILGLIPGVGDATGLLVSTYIVIQAIRLGAPKVTLMHMVLIIAIEAIIGTIPILGDLFDATFKANARNVRLLSLALDQEQADGTFPPPVDKGTVALVIAALIGVVLLVGVVVALSWSLASLFT